MPRLPAVNRDRLPRSNAGAQFQLRELRIDFPSDVLHPGTFKLLANTKDLGVLRHAGVLAREREKREP